MGRLSPGSIARALLVPAAMRLLGNANWWFPRWSNWLPDLRVEAGPEAGAGRTTTRQPVVDPAPIGTRAAVRTARTPPERGLIEATEAD